MSRWPVVRRDLIGRRFFALKCSQEGGEQSVDIRKGVIRASTHAECSAVEAKVLVEYDDAFHWKARKWVAIYSDFDVFLVEDTLVGIVEEASPQGQYKLALEFMMLVDKRNHSNHLHHVENLLPDRPVQYVPNSRILRLKEEDYAQLGGEEISEACRSTLSSWMQFQQSQQIMVNYPSRAVDHIVKVYNIESSSQWYMGRITGFNENTKFVTIVDENGKEHRDHCALVQMELRSKDSASILRDIAACTGTKTRGRLSFEEHPVNKQPKLDLPVGGESLNVQRSQPLHAGNEFQGTQIVAVDSGSRNIFQAVFKADAEQSPVQATKLPGGTIQSTKSLGKPNDWTIVSTRGLEPSKIKSLLGYRPPSVMIVLPTPCVAAGSCATSDGPTLHSGVVPRICSDQNLARELLGSEKGVNQFTVNSRQPQSSTGSTDCPPSGVQFAGSVMLQQAQKASSNLLRNLKTACRNAAPMIKGVQNVNNLGPEATTGVWQTIAVPRGQIMTGFCSLVSTPTTHSTTGRGTDQLLPGMNEASQPGKTVGPGRSCGQQIFSIRPLLQSPSEVKLVPRTSDPRSGKLNEDGSVQAACLIGTEEVPQPNGLQALDGANSSYNQQIIAPPQIQQQQHQNDLQRVSEGQRSSEVQGLQQLRMPGTQKTGGLLVSLGMQGQNKVQQVSGVQAPNEVLQIRLPVNRNVDIGQQFLAALQIQGLQAPNSLQSAPSTSKIMGTPGTQPVTSPGVKYQQRPGFLQGISSAGGFERGRQVLRRMTPALRPASTQVPADLASVSHISSGNHVGPDPVVTSDVLVQQRPVVKKNQDFQSQPHGTSVVHGGCRGLPAGEGMQQQQVPSIVSVVNFASGDPRIARDGGQRPQYTVAGGRGPRMFPTASAQVNANRMAFSSPRFSDVNCMRRPRYQSILPQTAGGRLVQEVVVGNVPRTLGPSSAEFAPFQFNQKRERVINCSSNQTVVPHSSNQTVVPRSSNQTVVPRSYVGTYSSMNSDRSSCMGIQSSNKNALDFAACNVRGATGANQGAKIQPSAIATSIQTERVGTGGKMNPMPVVNVCRYTEDPRGTESNCTKFSAPHLGAVGSVNFKNSAAVSTLLAPSRSLLQQQAGRGCDLQKQMRRSHSRFYEVKLGRGPRAAPKPFFEAGMSAPKRQLSAPPVPECPGQLSSDLKPPQNVKLASGKEGILRADSDGECRKPLGQSDRPANDQIGGYLKAAPLSQVSLTGKGKNRGWFEEYENELMDLSRVLDMMKRLDNGPFVGVGDYSTSQMDRKPKLMFSNQNDQLSMADNKPHHSTHHHDVVPLKKSDCETKMDLLRQQMLAHGLNFENPSIALSKKKLNSFNMSCGGLRTFIQDKSCLELPSVLQKCRECKSAYNSQCKLSQVLCRFHAFRRLMRNAKGGIVSGGFSNPTDADAIDISLWMPMLPIVDPQIDVDMAKYIIRNVGSRFCELVEQEKDAMSLVSSNNEVAWKQAVNGIREMCDVCSTTLFNIHWVCRKCGYVACLDCYRTIMRKCLRCHGDVDCKYCDLGHLKWARCSVDRQPHEAKEMMLTQIIPSDVLWVVGRIIHDIRKKWNILEECPCGENKNMNLLDNARSLEQVNHVTQSDETVSSTNSRVLVSDLKPAKVESVVIGEPSQNYPDVKVTGTSTQIQPVESSCDRNIDCKNLINQGSPTLRDFLLEKNCEFDSVKGEKLDDTGCKSLDNVLQKVLNGRQSRLVPLVTDLKSPSDCQTTTGNSVTPGPGNLDLPSAKVVPHVWLDSGRLLQLIEPHHPGNLRMFQEVWQKGKPVVISNCEQHITKELWLPETFAEEFGDMENDLVDCTHKVVLIGHKMRLFWQGFEKVTARLKDSRGEPMILKLKDWPPMEDFSEMLPSRFKDLLQGLPLPEYTHRSGVFNLVSRLPEYFVRPDLGPKMYNAYGSALHPMVGSTNLHLDVSDAVNLILYVGIPKDDAKDHEAAAMEGMRTAGCCELTMARITDEGHKPGALWHIFDAKDSNKIRDLLTKVGLEIGEPVEPHHDPIHDQSWYLDEALRERLLREYSVQSYTLVQCIGDAIFIPAGAPHQVRNFHSCIKAAEDFVSPENLSHCFQLTQEFRHLSDTHSNHEDKLQVKNVIYHAVKDAIAVLQSNVPDNT